MKRILMSGLSVALLLGVVGCGGGGIEPGVPQGDLTPTVKMDPKMTDPGGMFGAQAAKSAAAKSEKAKASAPGGETPAAPKAEP
jgi:hypothetical protein